MLSGPLPRQETAKLATERSVVAEADPLAEHLKTWWSIELQASYGCVSWRSKEGERALEMLKKAKKLDVERYDVGLLWKKAYASLPKKYSSAI